MVKQVRVTGVLPPSATAAGFNSANACNTISAILGTDDDAVWFHEVFDGRAFLEEFRVGDDAERPPPPEHLSRTTKGEGLGP
jgi:hypothetical protein